MTIRVASFRFNVSAGSFYLTLAGMCKFYSDKIDEIKKHRCKNSTKHKQGHKKCLAHAKKVLELKSDSTNHQMNSRKSACYVYCDICIELVDAPTFERLSKSFSLKLFIAMSARFV